MIRLEGFSFLILLISAVAAVVLGIIGRPPRAATNQIGDNARTNGFAIASLVLSLVGLSLLAIIFGHAAKSQMRRTGESAYGLASWGLFLGYIELIATIGAVAYVLTSAR